MLAITLGYAAAGRTEPPVILYAGNDATTAEAIFTAPPDGIIRTELYKNPPVTRRRYFEALPSPAAVIPAPTAPAGPAEDDSPPAKPTKAKA